MTSNLTLSRPVQLLALVGLLAVVGGGGMLLLKSRSTPAPPVVAPSVRPTQPAPAKTTAPPAKPHAKGKVKHAARARARKTPLLKAANTVGPPVTASGMPLALAQALQQHRVVVVSLFDPQSQTDAFAYAEAKAGAKAAGAGFLPVDLLQDRIASPLTAILPGGGLLPDPGVLVFSAPHTLAVRLDGFADRDAVAQAAVQAYGNGAAAAP